MGSNHSGSANFVKNVVWQVLFKILGIPTLTLYKLNIYYILYNSVRLICQQS